MGKKEKEFMLGREQGFRFGIYTLEKYGVEYLEKDIRFRKGTGINADVATDQIEEIDFSDKKNCMYESIIVMALNVLHDKFDIGTKRAMPIMTDWFNSQKDMYGRNYVEWWEARNEIIERLKIKKFTFSDKPYNARIKPYDEGRISGMEFILKLAKDGKTDELKAKKAMLSKVKIPIHKLQKCSENTTDALQQLHYDFMLLKMVDIVHSRLGYGEIRMNRFLALWDEKAMCLLPNKCDDILDTYYCRWIDLVEVIRDELKIDLPTNNMIAQGLIESEVAA